MGKLYTHTTQVRPLILEKHRGKNGYMFLLNEISGADHFMAYMDGYLQAMRESNKTAITLDQLETLMIDIYNRAFSKYKQEQP
jgi:hypothetical protein